MDFEDHEDWATAVHEAGHAVMCCELNVSIDYMEIDDEGGAVVFKEEPPASKRVLILLAGPFAEFSVIGNDWTQDWASRESNEIVKYAREALEDSGFEPEDSADFEEELSNYLTEARNEANALLYGRSGQIESLAKALIRERVIPGRDVESYIFGK